MTFSSLPFLLFLPLVLLLLAKIKDAKKQQVFLLLASYFFYAWWDVRFLLLMIAETAVCWALALWMKRSPAHAGRICTAGIVTLLGILGIFKYFNFFSDTLFALLGMQNPLTLSILLPIGISFYTFQGISYLVDVRCGTVEAQTSFVRISLYISFFAQLVAGPIVRSSDFLPQLDNPVRITRANLYEGIQIFLFGFIKKRVFADRIGSFVTAVYAAPTQYATPTLWLAILSYAVQIYFDFSGYSDMAIGTAKMMGFSLGRNFNAPYLAHNPSEFWKRWHISLSQWLRDYLYFPLGGSRCSLPRTCVNLMITMLLAGLWHGANWNYIVWGGMQGLAQVVHKIWRHFVPQKQTPARNLLSTFGTILFVVLTFIIFRSSDFTTAAAVAKGVFVPQTGIQTMYLYAVLGILLTVICHLLAQKRGRDAYYPILTRARFRDVLLLTGVILLAAAFAYNGETPFIYFQF